METNLLIFNHTVPKFGMKITHKITKQTNSWLNSLKLQETLKPTTKRNKCAETIIN